MTLEPTMEARIKQRYAMQVMQLVNKLHFTPEELDVLVIIYHKIVKSKEGIDKSNEMHKNQFRQFMYCVCDMTDDLLTERIFATLDKTLSNYTSFETFASALSLWLRGTRDEKINYCFSVYDTLGDGFIRRETLFALLRDSIIKPSDDEADEGVRDLVDIIMKRMDLDRDGFISFDDYKSSVYRSPLLMQVILILI
ncbi:EF-hand calcium-binding domain-containing protein 1-like [Ctenocephalides felis]|uniref:EF-hand calcium-binding domain-containing protein 1-like n=1 Tax=Ctenocephalides felis TaxID=7515 RepID=UPI000E6E52AF|nr:EF-hand calcium-binding domain-containing protein 1-like [Ctenocephalides felis]